MQVLDANDLEATPIEGVGGALSLFPAVRESQFVTQLVVVPPHTKAPRLGNPLHEKMFIFVIQGSATFTNGEYYEKITPGKMILLDVGEERVYQTEKDKLLALEVKYHSKAKEPTPVQIAVPMLQEAPKKAVGEFFEA